MDDVGDYYLGREAGNDGGEEDGGFGDRRPDEIEGGAEEKDVKYIVDEACSASVCGVGGLWYATDRTARRLSRRADHRRSVRFSCWRGICAMLQSSISSMDVVVQMHTRSVLD